MEMEMEKIKEMKQLLWDMLPDMEHRLKTLQALTQSDPIIKTATKRNAKLVAQIKHHIRGML